MDAEQFAKVTYTFNPTHQDDLALIEGDIVKVLHKDESGWWSGECNGRRGIFPYNFVQLIETGAPVAPERKAGTTMKPEASTDRVVEVTCDMKYVKNHNELTIEVTTKAKNKIKGKKSVSEIRRLAKILEDAGKKVSAQLPPQWADRLDAFTTGKKYRTLMFQEFLRACIGDLVREYALVAWLDPKADYEAHETTKQRIQPLINSKPPAFTMKEAPVLARAMFDWKQRDELEIELIEEEIIAVISRNTQYDGWWMGESAHGKRGIFPFNYVSILSPKEAQEMVLSGTSKTTDSKAVAIGASKVVPNELKTSNKPHQVKQIKYLIGSIQAFDRLLADGYAMEEMNGEPANIPSAANCPKKGDFVRVRYTAYRWNPQLQQIVSFADHSSAPLDFKVGAQTTIPGLQKSVQKMEIGQHSRVIIAPEMGYGPVGNPPEIPPNAHLVYDLVLEDITKAELGGRESTFFGAGIAANLVAQRPVRTSVNFYNPKAGSGAPVKAKPTSENTGGGIQPQTMTQKVDYKKNRGKYTLAKLQEIVKAGEFRRYGVDPSQIEEYLTDEAFDAAFQTDRVTFMLMQGFKQRQLKADNKLL